MGDGGCRDCCMVRQFLNNVDDFGDQIRDNIV